MAKLTDSEVQDRLSRLDGWSLEEGTLRRKFTFPGFPDAVAFIVRLGFDAEAADHHPDLLISYKRVTVSYVTHSEGGITAKDFEGAVTATRHAQSLSGA